MATLESFLRYPLPQAEHWLDRATADAGRLGPIDCPVCGSTTVASGFDGNLRESGRCDTCGATNRQRQLALVLATVIEAADDPSGLAIYNTEASGALHDRLSRFPRYQASEYFGEGVESGSSVGGVRHEDLCGLSFADCSIDVVVSSDVFEHVPDPYAAHRECERVLRPGGRHVFTVPFLQTEYLDQRRAFVDESGAVVHVEEPMFHDDPLRPEGALVFTIFGLEMLVRLREIGFATRMYQLHAPEHGILGPNAIVFDAVKVV